MKLTRRNLATVLASAGVATAQQLGQPASQPASQPAAAPQAPPADDLLKTARDRMLANAAALNQPPIPMSIEPAFQFKV
jgi:hypothetical protein